MSDQYGLRPLSLVGQRVTYRDVAFWGKLSGTVVTPEDGAYVRVLWDDLDQPTLELTANLRPWPEPRWLEIAALCGRCQTRAASPLSVDGTRCLECQDAAFRYTGERP